MKLLIITQKVDTEDRNLGFFVSWIREFALRCEQVTVICLEKGVYELPPNVRVFSLGKETHNPQPTTNNRKRLRYALRFLKLIWRERENYDAVFVHMNPEYVLLGGPLWKLLAKRVSLWYVHKQVNLKLRLAERVADTIFTASKESCRLPSGKIEVVGHGIESTTNSEQDTKIRNDDKGKKVHLVTVGRITPVKDVRTLILGFQELKKEFHDAEFSIIGEPVTDSDRVYKTELVNLYSGATFSSLPYGTVFSTGHSYNAFVHASKTGSMDKAVLEALSAGLPVFTSSEAFSADIPGITKFKGDDPRDLALQISRAFKGNLGVIGGAGRAYVEEHHSLKRLIPRILSSLQS